MWGPERGDGGSEAVSRAPMRHSSKKKKRKEKQRREHRKRRKSKKGNEASKQDYDKHCKANGYCAGNRALA